MILNRVSQSTFTQLPAQNGTEPRFSDKRRNLMSVAKVTEITASSSKSFEDAIQTGIRRSTKTLDQVRGAWVHDHEVVVKGGKITEYKVRMKVTFILNE